MPAKAGIQGKRLERSLDPRLRGGDDNIRQFTQRGTSLRSA
jgi:hypothetical protein